jgi:hypothetical protein
MLVLEAVGKTTKIEVHQLVVGHHHARYVVVDPRLMGQQPHVDRASRNSCGYGLGMNTILSLSPDGPKQVSTKAGEVQELSNRYRANHHDSEHRMRLNAGPRWPGDPTVAFVARSM